MFVAVRELLAVVAAGVALCNIDDVLIDIFYFVRLIWRRLTIYRRFPRATVAHLPVKPPAPMAIFVPAWNESAVIGAMLRDLLARLDYPAFHVFVGTYANDPATRTIVEAVVDARVTCVVNRREGPTTKADNLNVLWSALLGHEEKASFRFRAVVLHDAEDVVHPRELRIFDHLTGRRELVQLPVAPLPDRASRWVAGTYQDEFAEAHLKDLVVREAIGAAVPSAGVACAIDRRMLGRIADLSGGLPFDPACVTEDYEIGLRIHALGGRGCIVRIPGDASDNGVVATREYFPATFRSAVRQKSRWLLGIALQGWDRVGWQGGVANRLMLLRDRKSIVAALFTLLAYVGLIAAVAVWAARIVYPPARSFPPLLEPGHALRPLIRLNGGILVWRLLVRAGCVWRAYGPFEALRSLPRALVGNAVNIAAALLAMFKYVRIGLGLARPYWDKTAHRFPAPAE